jgi:hypothetical protein
MLCWGFNSPKHQSAGRHVTPLRHVILILKHQIVVLSGEAADTNLIVIDLTRSAFEPTIHCTRGEHANHYTTDAVQGAVKQLEHYRI